MKVIETTPPRLFKVGSDRHIELKDCGKIVLDVDEQITFLTNDGKEFDVVRKKWGYYATPSLNGRLRSFNLRTAFVESAGGKCFVLLVEAEQQTVFETYLKDEGMSLICWLDEEAILTKLKKAVAK